MKRFLTAALIITLGNNIVTNAADIEIYTDKEIYVEQSETEKSTEETTEIMSETEKLTEETTEIETNQVFETASEAEKMTEEITETIFETEKIIEETTETKDEEDNSHKTDIDINNNNVVNINNNKGNIYITIINGVTVAVNSNGDIIDNIDISDINSIDILNEETTIETIETTTTEETEITTETATINEAIEYEKSPRRSSGGTRRSHSSNKPKNDYLSHKTESSTDKVTKADNKTNSIKTKSDKKTAVLSIGSNKIDIDGTVKTFDSAPYISDKSYTLLPLRAIASLFDDTQVSWDVNTKTATIISDGNTALFTINSDIMVYNRKESVIPQSAELKDSRTYVPIRAISEALGADIIWDSPTKTITITK